MWASAEEVGEWKQVQRAIDGHHALLLTAMGCGPVLSAQFEPPFANHFNPGELMPDQLVRLMRQIDGAQRIVVVRRIRNAQTALTSADRALRRGLAARPPTRAP